MIKKNKFEDKLKLLIIDNPSDKYNIFSLLKEFQSKSNSKFLKILKNNIGMAENIIKKIKLARREFYFFLSNNINTEKGIKLIVQTT
jgi:hypothetical protein